MVKLALPLLEVPACNPKYMTVPLIILSAYLITIATNKPPKAWLSTTIHAILLNPWRIPWNKFKPYTYKRKLTFSRMISPSFKCIPPKANRAPNKPSWMFRSQIEAELPFRIFSKYTPAKPDEIQDIKTAMNPMNWLWPSLLTADSLTSSD